MKEQAPGRVFVVDDHPLIRSGLRYLVEDCADFMWVGEAQTAAEALLRVPLVKPDIVVMDIQLLQSPEAAVDGIAIMRQLLAKHTGMRFIILTMFDDARMVQTALQAGASAYLLKGADADEMRACLRAVMRGQTVLGGEIHGRVAKILSGSAAPPFPDLTPREREILQLLAEGLNYQSIAGQLHISAGTVRNYAASIFEKIGVHDRAEAMLKARALGLGV